MAIVWQFDRETLCISEANLFATVLCRGDRRESLALVSSLIMGNAIFVDKLTLSTRLADLVALQAIKLAGKVASLTSARICTRGAPGRDPFTLPVRNGLAG